MKRKPSQPQPSPAAHPALAGELVEAAKHYHDLGLNLLPIGKNAKAGDLKKPLVNSWKPYQKHRMPLADLIAVLERPDATGIGIITGPTSCDLYVRDFDQPGAYAAWAAAYPDLAAKLPTETTGRPDGRHVFFRSTEALKTTKLADGEIRGAGVFTVIAPSLHQSGRRYQWVRPLVRLEDVPIVEPAMFNAIGVTEIPRHRETEDTEETEGVCSASPSLCITSVEDAIEATIPRPGAKKKRNDAIFDFARMLKMLFPDADAMALKDHVRAWHARALPFIENKAMGQHVVAIHLCA